LLVCPMTPASTLGFAAASMTPSTLGSDSKSLGFRRSPCRKRMPCSFIVCRFCSLPARLRLSKPKTSTPSTRRFSSPASSLPTNPQTPVISTFIRRAFRLACPGQAVVPGGHDFLHNLRERVGDSPPRIVLSDLPQVAIITGVVANAALIEVRISLLPATQSLDHLERLKNRA